MVVLVFFLIAVAALVGMFHVTSLWSQVLLAWWVVIATIMAARVAAKKKNGTTKEH